MIRFSIVCVLLAGLTGCGSGAASDPELVGALEVLKSGLDAWKNGATPASLNAGATPVQFSDSDWQAGAKLREYRILKAGGEDDGETVCTVHLKTEMRGKAVERSVNYRVTLTPKRAVARYPTETRAR